MTLAEIREKYGVPAEVGMRVTIGDLPRCMLYADIVRECSCKQGNIEVECGAGLFSCHPSNLTYYDKDGAVIWAPGGDEG